MRSLVSFSIVIVATKQVGSYGTVALATNEILRQTYLFSIQFLSSMDVSAQALVASHLGKVCISSHWILQMSFCVVFAAMPR